MKYCFAFLIVVVAFSLNAQTSHYFPLPESNAMWTKLSGSSTGSLCGTFSTGYHTITYSDYINGDTNILGTTYHKIYISAMYHHEYCDPPGNIDTSWTLPGQYYGAFRQDSLLKTVYGFDSINNQEFLLYNFNINIGDSMIGSASEFGHMKLISIDSVLVGISFRKKYNFGIREIIEGIGIIGGSNDGSFYCDLLQEPPIAASLWTDLICFSSNGNELYPDTSTRCNYVTKIEDFKNGENKILVYPNPFHNETIIRVNEKLIGSQLMIYNYMGLKVKEQKISTNRATLLRENLKDGIYFYRIIERNGEIRTGKIIIE